MDGFRLNCTIIMPWFYYSFLVLKLIFLLSEVDENPKEESRSEKKQDDRDSLDEMPLNKSCNDLAIKKDESAKGVIKKKTQANSPSSGITRKKVVFYQMCGSLFSDIERLLQSQGSKLEAEYQKYSMQAGQATDLMLDNVACYLGSMHLVVTTCSQKEKAYLVVPKVKSIQRWKESLEHLKQTKIDKEARLLVQILDFALKSLEKGIAQPLPLELEDQIYEECHEEQSASEMTSSSQLQVLRLNHKAHKVAAITSEQLSEYDHKSPDEIEFSHDPLLTYEQGDIQQ